MAVRLVLRSAKAHAVLPILQCVPWIEGVVQSLALGELQ
jgi:hypothetical protein